MTSHEFLKQLRDYGIYPRKITYNKPSNSELYRCLKQKAVIINGSRLQPNDTIEFPITQLVFFPNNPTTIF